MGTCVFIGVLLLALLGMDAIPSSRRSCYKKTLLPQDCHNIAGGTETLRPIGSLQNHYWGGRECAMVCYCSFSELLCCPRDVFFGSKISFVIPCKPE